MRQILETPRHHLPEGYPYCTDDDSGEFLAIWQRAFEIHEDAHHFGEYPTMRVDGCGFIELGPRRGILSPVIKDLISMCHYCDCYERAYIEVRERRRIVAPIEIIVSRKFRLCDLAKL